MEMLQKQQAVLTEKIKEEEERERKEGLSLRFLNKYIDEDSGRLKRFLKQNFMERNKDVPRFDRKTATKRIFEILQKHRYECIEELYDVLCDENSPDPGSWW